MNIELVKKLALEGMVALSKRGIDVGNLYPNVEETFKWMEEKVKEEVRH